MGNNKKKILSRLGEVNMKLQTGFIVLAHIEDVAAKIYENSSVLSDKERNRVLKIFAEEERKDKVQILNFANNEYLKNQELDNQFYELFKNALSYITTNGKELHLMSQKDFFGFALQEEKNSYEIYTALLQHCKDDNLGNIVVDDLIKNKQKRMFFILDQLYEYNDLSLSN